MTTITKSNQINFKISYQTEINISEEQVRNLIVSAIELEGINYWARIYKYIPPKDIPLCVVKKPYYCHIPFMQNASMLIEEYEDDMDKTPISIHRFNINAIQEGLRKMAAYRHPKPNPNVRNRISNRHWDNLVNENDDIETADVFMQLALLGEIKYG